MKSTNTPTFDFWAALQGRCPRCGKARVMHGFGRVDPVCPSCGLDLAKLERADGPAVFLIFILGFIITPLAIYTGMVTDWPLWMHALIWSVITIGSTLALLVPAKALLMHMQYRHKPEDFDQ